MKLFILASAPPITPFLCWISLCISSLVYSQKDFSSVLTEVDLSSVTSFSREDYQSNDQFHTMIEEEDGYLLFGNNDGVLIWDGAHWDLIQLPNFSAVMGLSRDHRGDIWVSGFNEVGVLKRDAYGVYRYESKTEALGLENTGLENITNLVRFGDAQILQYDHEIVMVKDQVATRIKARNNILYSGTVNGQFLLHDMNHGLYLLNPESLELELLLREDLIDHERVSLVFPGDTSDQLQVITAEGGFYDVSISRGTAKKLRNVFTSGEGDMVNTGIRTPDGGFILGTQSSKIIEIKPDGTVNRKYYLNEKIKSSTVEKLFRDTHGNIWVLLTKGLNYINFNSGYSQFLEGVPVFDVLLGEDQLYVATNQGVFLMPAALSRDRDLKKVPNLNGQVWSLNPVGDNVLVGYHDGLYEMSEEGAQLIFEDKGIGFWGVCPVPERDDVFLATSYKGFYRLELVDGQIRVMGRVEGFEESTRDLAPSLEDPYTFWVCHGYKGVFRVKFNRTYTKVLSTEFFTSFNGLESPYNILVREFDGRTVFTTNTGIYTFDDSLHRFVKDEELNDILDPSKNTTFLKRAFDKTWFISEEALGYFRNDSPELGVVAIPFSDLKNTFIKTMECVIPVSEDRVLVGNNNGITLFGLYSEEQCATESMPTIITKVEVLKDGETDLLKLHPESTPEINEADNITIGTEFSNPQLSSYAKVYYSYLLEGHGDQWSEWSEEAGCNFSGLQGGNYTLRVRSKGANGVAGGEASYAFSVVPVWYATWWWYGFLLVLVVLLCWIGRAIIIKRIKKERETANLKLQQSRKLMHLEMEKYKLKLHQEKVEKEKHSLELDVVEKSKELANYALLLSKRKELFRELYDELRVLRRHVRNPENKRILKDVFNKLENARIGEKYLEIFDVNFERVHQEFIEQLRTMGIHLTKREEQLCALIKMELSNKEIAPILNLSVRGVESARYRLRKKLQVAPSDTLSEFFENFKTANME